MKKQFLPLITVVQVLMGAFAPGIVMADQFDFRSGPGPGPIYPEPIRPLPPDRDDRREDRMDELRTRVLRKAESINDILQRNLLSLNSVELRRIEAALTTAIREARDTGDTYPTPIQPGPGFGRACELNGAGVHAGRYYNMTIEVGNTVVAGANTLEDAAYDLQRLEAARVCKVFAVQCEVDQGAIVGGRHYPFAAEVGGRDILGFYSYEGARHAIETLSRAGACH